MLTKLVNGVPVICSSDEEMAIKAEWDAVIPSKQNTAADSIINNPTALAALKTALDGINLDGTRKELVV